MFSRRKDKALEEERDKELDKELDEQDSLKKDKRKKKLKGIRIVFVAVVVLLVILTLVIKAGVIHIKWIDEFAKNKAEVAEQKKEETFANAKTVYDLLPYMELKISGYPKKILTYSEMDDSDDFKNIVNIFSDENQYTIIEHKGEKYLVLVYRVGFEDGALKKVKAVEKEYNGKTLRLSFDVNTVKKDYTISFYERLANCFIKLDGEVDRVFVDGVEFEKYAGGIINCDGEGFILSDDLSLKYQGPHSLQFMIRTYDYFLLEGEGTEGVIDVNGDIVIEPIYKHVKALDDNKFLAVREEAGNEIFLILDKNNKLLKVRDLKDGKFEDVKIRRGQCKIEVRYYSDENDTENYEVEYLDDELETVVPRSEVKGNEE